MKFRHMALFAAASLALAGAAVKADTIVTYTVTGAFTDTGSPPFTVTNAGTTSTVADANGNSVSFDFAPVYVSGTATVPDNGEPSAPVQFGRFFSTLDITNPITSANFSAETISFTLNIQQLNPMASSGNLVASLTGAIKYDPSASLTPTLKLVFAQNQLVLPGPGGFIYTVPKEIVFADSTSPNAYTFNGTVSAVPLPAAAWSGMTLLGLVGGAQYLRRRALSR